MDWPAAVQLLVIAAATAALAFFGWVQLQREGKRVSEQGEATKRKLRGSAWLARRSCEVVLRSAPGMQNYSVVAEEYDSSPGLDRLQQLFREVLAFSAEVGGANADLGTAAFEAFLAATDDFQEVHNPTTPATVSPLVSVILADRALHSLHDAVSQLEALAPRQPQEPKLADPFAFRKVADAARKKLIADGGTLP